MRILSIGITLDRSAAQNASFGSPISFLDYDLVICDLSTALSDYSRQWASPTYMGYPCLDDDSFVQLRVDMRRRKTEMKELLKLGRMLVVFTPPPVLCYAATGEKQTSGTGRNARVTRIVTQINLLDCLPINVSTVAAEGESIELRGGEPFKAFWKANEEHLCYEAYFDSGAGQPIFCIKGTDRIVGCYQQIENGHLLFIPPLKALAEARQKRAAKILLESLLALFDELKKNAGDFEMPTWAGNYLLPNEEDQKNSLKVLEGELATLLARITEQKEKIVKLEQYKILICGSGRALEVQVRKILEEVGFTVQEGGAGRDDLILQYKGRVAVAEIKGVGKSAAEKHAAQLEKWVSEYFSAHSVQPKGILICESGVEN